MMTYNDCIVSVKQISKEICLHRTHTAKYIRKIGIEPIMRRCADSGNNHSCLTVTNEEYQYIIKTRIDEGYLSTNQTSSSTNGYFYIIQVIPEFSEFRVKLGFADNVETRLSQHKTSAPSAKILNKWDCERTWEKTIIDYVLKLDHEKIGNEVFEFKDIKKLISHIDILFNILNSTNQE